ncbi:hypothetical protein O6H91_16G026600 [Diphasiastrum complanatum]|uniref:Uncharacterized protein n=1 Tax=Diphasiastrum complanatum TaxID=34168 RepID=A0ACC2BAT8_DIPCM|nr:hypothetical protein O6H91_16G026600 [Diphasiastrum complanatum]
MKASLKHKLAKLVRVLNFVSALESCWYFSVTFKISANALLNKKPSHNQQLKAPAGWTQWNLGPLLSKANCLFLLIKEVSSLQMNKVCLILLKPLNEAMIYPSFKRQHLQVILGDLASLP